MKTTENHRIVGAHVHATLTSANITLSPVDSDMHGIALR